MSFLRLFVRSFHPQANFGISGLGYHGDDRGFSTSEGVTSRIYAIVRIGIASPEVKLEIVDSDPSSGFTGVLHQDYSDPRTKPTANLSGQVDPYREDGDQGGQLLLSYTGQNFAQPLGNSQTAREYVWENVVPGLDVTCSFHFDIDRDDETIEVALRMTGDGFPNAEAFVQDRAKTPLMLVTHRRIGSALAQLWGNRRIAMGVGSGRAAFPSDKFGSDFTCFTCIDYAEVTGGPIDVRQETGKQPATVAKMTEMHVKRDARGAWGRRYLGDNLPIFAPGRKASSMP